jgi:branched-subunit amino acid ABC-type transport system permease component
MSTVLLFLILGIGAGAVYAMLGLGLVLKYRSAGSIDFAHGAMAMFAAYVFVELRDEGRLQLPWPILPHEIQISDSMPTAAAMAVTLVYTALLGLLLYRLVYRPLLRAAPLTKVCASVGIMLVLQRIASLNFGTRSRSTRAVLPSGSVDLGLVSAPVDRFYFAGVVVVLGVAMAAIYKYTAFGLATRASAENERGAALAGVSAPRIAALNWTIASLLAGLAGMLIAPISTLDPGSYTLFVIPALGAALLARFTSFAGTLAAGLGIGMLQSLLTKLVVDFEWLPRQGLPQAVPFLVVVLALVAFSKRLPARGESDSWRQPSLGVPRHPFVYATIAFVGGSVLLFVLQGSLRAALISSIIVGCISLSLVVLTGYVGQVSLAQMALAGVGAFMVGHIGIGANVPFPLSFVLAGLSAVPVGLLIGLPALRFRGVNLAIITLASAVALDAMLFNTVWFAGGEAGLPAGSPAIGPIDLGINADGERLRPVFGMFALAVTCLLGIWVARMRLGTAGRIFAAVRSNERAAAASGVNVAVAKLYAFGIASFIAGLGGALLGYQQVSVAPASFGVFASLALLAGAYVAGIGRIAGVVVAGALLSVVGLVPTFLDNLIDFGRYIQLVGGVLLAATAVLNPDGLASTEPGAKGPGPPFSKLGRRLVARLGLGDDAGPPAGATAVVEQ